MRPWWSTGGPGAPEGARPASPWPEPAHPPPGGAEAVIDALRRELQVTTHQLHHCRQELDYYKTLIREVQREQLQAASGRTRPRGDPATPRPPGSRSSSRRHHHDDDDDDDGDASRPGSGRGACSPHQPVAAGRIRVLYKYAPPLDFLPPVFVAEYADVIRIIDQYARLYHRFHVPAESRAPPHGGLDVPAAPQTAHASGGHHDLEAAPRRSRRADATGAREHRGGSSATASSSSARRHEPTRPRPEETAPAPAPVTGATPPPAAAPSGRPTISELLRHAAVARRATGSQSSPGAPAPRGLSCTPVTRHSSSPSSRASSSAASSSSPVPTVAPPPVTAAALFEAFAYPNPVAAPGSGSDDEDARRPSTSRDAIGASGS